jgi:hypothetical protein
MVKTSSYLNEQIELISHIDILILLIKKHKLSGKLLVDNMNPNDLYKVNMIVERNEIINDRLEKLIKTIVEG